MDDHENLGAHRAATLARLQELRKQMLTTLSSLVPREDGDARTLTTLAHKHVSEMWRSTIADFEVTIGHSLPEMQMTGLMRERDRLATRLEQFIEVAENLHLLLLGPLPTGDITDDDLITKLLHESRSLRQTLIDAQHKIAVHPKELDVDHVSLKQLWNVSIAALELAAKAKAFSQHGSATNGNGNNKNSNGAAAVLPAEITQGITSFGEYMEELKSASEVHDLRVELRRKEELLNEAHSEATATETALRTRLAETRARFASELEKTKVRHSKYLRKLDALHDDELSSLVTQVLAALGVSDPVAVEERVEETLAALKDKRTAALQAAMSAADEGWNAVDSDDEVLGDEEDAFHGDHPPSPTQRSLVSTYRPGGVHKFEGQSVDNLRKQLDEKEREMGVKQANWMVQTKARTLEWQSAMRDMIQKYESAALQTNANVLREKARAQALQRTVDDLETQLKDRAKEVLTLRTQLEEAVTESAKSQKVAIIAARRDADQRVKEATEEVEESRRKMEKMQARLSELGPRPKAYVPTRDMWIQTEKGLAFSLMEELGFTPGTPLLKQKSRSGRRRSSGGGMLGDETGSGSQHGSFASRRSSSDERGGGRAQTAGTAGHAGGISNASAALKRGVNRLALVQNLGIGGRTRSQHLRDALMAEVDILDANDAAMKQKQSSNLAALQQLQQQQMFSATGSTLGGHSRDPAIAPGKSSQMWAGVESTARVQGNNTNTQQQQQQIHNAGAADGGNDSARQSMAAAIARTPKPQSRQQQQQQVQSPHTARPPTTPQQQRRPLGKQQQNATTAVGGGAKPRRSNNAAAAAHHSTIAGEHDDEVAVVVDDVDGVLPPGVAVHRQQNDDDNEVGENGANTTTNASGTSAPATTTSSSSPRTHQNLSRQEQWKRQQQSTPTRGLAAKTSSAVSNKNNNDDDEDDIFEHKTQEQGEQQQQQQQYQGPMSFEDLERAAELQQRERLDAEQQLQDHHLTTNLPGVKQLTSTTPVVVNDALLSPEALRKTLDVFNTPNYSDAERMKALVVTSTMKPVAVGALPTAVSEKRFFLSLSRVAAYCDTVLVLPKNALPYGMRLQQQLTALGASKPPEEWRMVKKISPMEICAISTYVNMYFARRSDRMQLILTQQQQAQHALHQRQQRHQQVMRLHQQQAQHQAAVGEKPVDPIGSSASSSPNSHQQQQLQQSQHAEDQQQMQQIQAQLAAQRNMMHRLEAIFVQADAIVQKVRSANMPDLLKDVTWDDLHLWRSIDDDPNSARTVFPARDSAQLLSQIIELLRLWNAIKKALVDQSVGANFGGTLTSSPSGAFSLPSPYRKDSVSPARQPEHAMDGALDGADNDTGDDREIGANMLPDDGVVIGRSAVGAGANGGPVSLGSLSQNNNNRQQHQQQQQMGSARLIHDFAATARVRSPRSIRQLVAASNTLVRSARRHVEAQRQQAQRGQSPQFTAESLMDLRVVGFKSNDQ